jgi:tetratricopeptide (TPR) repeat protein
MNTKPSTQKAAASGGNRDDDAGDRASPAARGWLLVLAAGIAVLAAGWWGVRAYRNAAARKTLASLQPVASLVPEDPPERREALEIADQLLRDYPDSPDVLYVRGTLLSRYGFNDEAVKTWQVCLDMYPDLAPVYEQLGLDAFRRGQGERTVELLRKAIQLDPESSVAGLCLGETLNSLGRMDEAIPVLEQYLQKSPHSAEAHFQLGQAYMYLKDYEQAKTCHEAALREDPQYVQACYGLALAYGRLGDQERSEAYRKKYADMIAQSRLVENRRVRQNSDLLDRQQALARAYFTAGTIYQDHGRTEQARELWKKAAEVDPTFRLPGAAQGDSAGRGPRPAPAGR